MAADEQEQSQVSPGRISALGSIAIDVMAPKGGFVFDREYYFDPEHRWDQDKRIARWAEQTYAPYPIYNAEALLVQLDFQPIPYRQVGGLQPNLLLGVAVGAEFVFFGDQDPDITPYPLKDLKAQDLADLEAIEWEKREPIATFLAQLDELRGRYHGEVDVFPPLFWDRSGRATVHGPVTTALKLMGEGFYLAMFDDFDFAMRFLTWISDAYVKLIRLFSQRAELPITGIHIGECSGCMISPEHWRRAVIPAMNRMVDACGPVRIHSCGNSDHILEPMSKVNNLGILNVGTGTSIAKSRELVGPDVPIHTIPDPRMLCFGKEQELRDWVEQSLAENADGPLEFQFHMDAAAPVKNAAAIYDALARHGYKPYDKSLTARWGV